MTIETAIALVKRIIAPKPLSRIQDLVFRQVWEGKSYDQIAKSEGYDSGYVKDAGATLWRCLSIALGEKVTKLNVRSVIERAAEQESQPATAPIIHPTLNLVTRPIAHNLPARDFEQLWGRDRELAQVLEFLSFNTASSCLTIVGMGGVGKTSLALAVAHYLQVLPQPEFTAIVFASAKPERLTAQGILPRLKPQRCLQDLFRTIARTLDRVDILWMEFEEQLEQIQDCLQRQPTLLILDNLETIEDQFLMQAFLHDLPASVKVLLTSRQPFSFPVLQLEPLSLDASLSLIQQQSQSKGFMLSPGEAQTLYDCTSGVPAAIVYAIGQVSAGYLIPQIGRRLTLPVGEYAHFYFKQSMTRLHGSMAHHLLMALSLFPAGASEAAIAHVVGGTAATMPGLAQLQQFSLVQQQEGRYRLLALTREYALAELATHPNFAHAAYDRWVGWYHDVAQAHGGKDAKEWQTYAALEPEWENLQSAIEWCIERDRYEDVKQFWQQVSCYTHTQGSRRNRLSVWSRRLDWTEWLIQAAQQRQDWPTALTVVRDRAWTLTLLGQANHLEQASQLYEFAWARRQFGADDRLPIELAIDIAVLKIQTEEFGRAFDWLYQANQLLDEADLDESAIARFIVHILYYQGEIHYKTRRYSESETLFQQVLYQAQQLQWQRAIFLAKDWLADIAIHQRQFTLAQHWIEEGLQMAQANQDTCRIAFCQRSFARLEQARRNQSIAQRWAAEAQQGFESLGMLTEAQETAELLQTLAF
jgi:LuxR family glucitol operon transcriptional activator